MSETIREASAIPQGAERGIARQELEARVRPDITFGRYIPGIRLEVPWLIPYYKAAGVMNPDYDFHTRLGPEVLYQADPETDVMVAERLAEQVVMQRGKTPDIIIVCTSHLPPYDPKSKKPQRRANHVRQYLTDNAHRLGVPSPSEATKYDTKTVSAACSSTIVALDWLRELSTREDITGKEVLFIADETGYRRTIAEPANDKAYAGLLFSDRAIAMQFPYGNGLTVLSSWYDFDEKSEQERIAKGERPLLEMVTPPVHKDDDFLIVKRPPYGDSFQMRGWELREYFGKIMGNDPLDILLPSSDGRGFRQSSFLLQHQSSIRMINNTYIDFRWQWGLDSVVYTGRGIINYGNTSSASTLFDLQDGIEGVQEVNTKRAVVQDVPLIKTGDTGTLFAYGAGLSRGYAHVAIGKLAA